MWYVTFTCDNITLTCGNITLTCGNITLTCGNVTLTCGYLTFTCGHPYQISQARLQLFDLTYNMSKHQHTIYIYDIHGRTFFLLPFQVERGI